MKAILFKSTERFESFKNELEGNGIETIILDFAVHDWINYDYSDIDFVIYYPSFYFTSNHPLALSNVYDNLAHIHSVNSSIIMYPDPNCIRFYNDKYRQYLFLTQNNFPIPETYPIYSAQSKDIAESKLGYPLIIKNRYGAGGDYVFKVNNRKELDTYYELSQMNMYNWSSIKFYLKVLGKRGFYYYLVRRRQMMYPLLSQPLIAQRYLSIQKDLKTVTGLGKVAEAHWRYPVDESMWKMNIDGGGIGEWSHVPDSAIELSERLAKVLNVRWLNIDMIISDDNFLITEFSPVWHHYKYKEKSSFVYKDDYNIDMPLEKALNLENIIVESFIAELKSRML